ncbi:MAG: T9SS type A sorting domain-containing protein [Bacteroidetes bacterium]|nr:T9SS type A sorting domain-containing protein [Bacteroidota bacterium]
MGSGLPYGANKFYLDSSQNKLYAVGRFIDQSNDTLYGPIVWDGFDWNFIGTTDFDTLGQILSIIRYQDSLYITGVFQTYFGAPGDYILNYNNGNWDSLQFSANGAVHCSGEYIGALYFGGEFSEFYPLLSYGIICYSYPYWQTMPLLNLAGILKMKKFNSIFVFAGYLGYGSSYEGNIIGWDNFNYVLLGNGLSFSGASVPKITDMEVYQNQLYVSSNCRFNNVTNARNIVKFDGTDWSEVNGGVDREITSLQVYNGELFAAGFFNQAGGVATDGIAKWDGHKWCGLGSNFNGLIVDMAVYNNELIVSGDFTSIDGVPVNHIAKWVGGSYVDSCQSTVGIDEFSFSSIKLFPNPASDKLLIEINSGILQKITVYDLTGKLVQTFSCNTSSQELDISTLSPGLYFLDVISDQRTFRKRFVKN